MGLHKLHIFWFVHPMGILTQQEIEKPIQVHRMIVVDDDVIVIECGLGYLCDDLFYAME